MKKNDADRRFSLSSVSLILFFMFAEMISGIIIYTHFYPQEYLLTPRNTPHFPQNMWILGCFGLLILAGTIYLIYKQKKR